MLDKLFNAGVDVFRINMSHSTHEMARELLYAVREVAKRNRHPIGILADLQGPKFRLGEFGGGRVFVKDGAIFHFDQVQEAGFDGARIPASSADLRGVQAGHTLLLDDGKIRMRVIEKKKERISAEVLVGGALASRKGISLPDTLLPVGPLTEKDRGRPRMRARPRRGLDRVVVRAAWRGRA